MEISEQKSEYWVYSKILRVGKSFFSTEMIRIEESKIFVQHNLAK